MKLRVSAFIFAACITAAAQQPAHHWAIQVHGGAGDITRAGMDAKTEAACRAALTHAAEVGGKILDAGGSPVDAVEAAIRTLEDLTLFDTGRGAIFDAEGKTELDAAIMDGATLKAGSVASTSRTKHTISLARAVMDKSPHVMLVGPGADAFGAKVGLETVDPIYFWNEANWQGLIRQLKQEGRPLPPRPANAPPAPPQKAAALDGPIRHIYGTVGVVAMDRNGNLAAGTSTGGSQGKLPGRVGDSPIIGAGTYASNSSCAVSATGVGEYFIRLGIAREVCNLVQFKGMPLQQAADQVIHKELETLKGVGGVIAITPDGQMAYSYNTPGMYRARLVEGGKPEIKIFADEP